MFTLKQILVATDFSDSSNVALAYGRALARAFGAQLHVIHTVEALMPDAFGASGYIASLPELQAEIEQGERQQLEALVTADDRRDLRAVTHVATFVSPAHAIVDYATNAHIDLVVVGTHGRRGLAHLVMGSVAEHVVRTAPCPVLTVRHPEREFVAPDVLAAGTAATV